MNNTHASRQVSKLAGKDSTPTVKVVGFKTIGDDRAHIIADVVHTSTSRENREQVVAALGNHFDRKLVAIDGSFTSLNNGRFVERVQGVMKLNVQAHAYEAGMAGFRSVSSNLFMDEEDGMWALRKTESGDILVKDLGIGDHESLRNLMQAVCSSGSLPSREMREVETALASVASQLEGGDFIKYASKYGKVSFGFVITASDTEGNLIVLPTDSENPEEVEGAAVLEAYDTKEFPDTEFTEQEEIEASVSAARGVVDIGAILSYYKKVYARSPAFYAEFAKRVRAHSFC